ncbi:MAG TPA: YceI family protein [Bacteroidia bacterium]|nr:YceI family protein [Bacteroidia bacterium]
MYRPLLLLLVFYSFISGTPPVTKYYHTNTGYVAFRSDAPQEIISAKSNQLRGILDIEKKVFVFKVSLNTFDGFNSGLQREHFNDKFLETEVYPEVIFSGKIIEDIDFEHEGTYTLRAKGKLSVHGIEQERILKVTVTVHHSIIYVESRFNILLADHSIKVPKVVHEKIASEIGIDVKAELKPKH